MSTITVSTVLSSLYCCKCGILFALPEIFESERRNDHAIFYCPTGHSNYYPHKTVEERLRDELAEKEKARLSAIQSREAALIREKNAIAEAEHFRKKSIHVHKRAAAGVCPCCKRTVAQMARHMKTKHPHFVATV